MTASLPDTHREEEEEEEEDPLAAGDSGEEDSEEYYDDEQDDDSDGDHDLRGMPDVEDPEDPAGTPEAEGSDDAAVSAPAALDAALLQQAEVLKSGGASDIEALKRSLRASKERMRTEQAEAGLLSEPGEVSGGQVAVDEGAETGAETEAEGETEAETEAEGEAEGETEVDTEVEAEGEAEPEPEASAAVVPKVEVPAVALAPEKVLKTSILARNAAAEYHSLMSGAPTKSRKGGKGKGAKGKVKLSQVHLQTRAAHRSAVRSSEGERHPDPAHDEGFADDENELPTTRPNTEGTVALSGVVLTIVNGFNGGYSGLNNRPADNEAPHPKKKLTGALSGQILRRKKKPEGAAPKRRSKIGDELTTASVALRNGLQAELLELKDAEESIRQSAFRAREAIRHKSLPPMRLASPTKFPAVENDPPATLNIPPPAATPPKPADQEEAKKAELVPPHWFDGTAVPIPAPLASARSETYLDAVNTKSKVSLQQRVWKLPGIRRKSSTELPSKAALPAEEVFRPSVVAAQISDTGAGPLSLGVGPAAPKERRGQASSPRARLARGIPPIARSYSLPLGGNRNDPLGVGDAATKALTKDPSSFSRKPVGRLTLAKLPLKNGKLVVEGKSHSHRDLSEVVGKDSLVWAGAIDMWSGSEASSDLDSDGELLLRTSNARAPSSLEQGGEPGQSSAAGAMQQEAGIEAQVDGRVSAHGRLERHGVGEEARDSAAGPSVGGHDPPPEWLKKRRERDSRVEGGEDAEQPGTATKTRKISARQSTGKSAAKESGGRGGRRSGAVPQKHKTGPAADEGDSASEQGKERDECGAEGSGRGGQEQRGKETEHNQKQLKFPGLIQRLHRRCIEVANANKLKELGKKNTTTEPGNLQADDSASDLHLPPIDASCHDATGGKLVRASMQYFDFGEVSKSKQRISVKQ